MFEIIIQIELFLHCVVHLSFEASTMAAEEELLVHGFVRNSFQFDIFPVEIMVLLVTWFGVLRDEIDKVLSDTGIKVLHANRGTGSCQIISGYSGNWKSTAIGQKIIAKGDTQKWKLQAMSDDPWLTIGIIEDDNVSKREDIGQLYSNQLHGYGISTNRGLKYHDFTTAPFRGARYFRWADLMNIKQNDVIILTLDLSQETNSNGLLMYDVETSEMKNEEMESEVNGDNIAFEVDIDKKWRFAVQFNDSETKVALL